MPPKKPFATKSFAIFPRLMAYSHVGLTPIPSFSPRAILILKLESVAINHVVTEEKQSAFFPGCTRGCVGQQTGLAGPSPTE